MDKTKTQEAAKPSKTVPVKQPQPTSGGTYVRNPETGELTLKSAPTAPRKAVVVK